MLLSFFAGLAAAPRAEALSRETRCRARIAAASRRHFDQTMQARQRCIKRIIKGEIPPSVNCITGEGDKKLRDRLILVQSRLTRALPRSCAGINLVLLDYPGACVDSTGAPFDTGDVEQCIKTSADAAITDLLTKEFPPLDRFYRDARGTCLRGVGNRAFAMIRDDIRARHACLLRQEKLLFKDPVDCRADIPPYGPGTGDDKTDVRIRNAYVNLLSGVPVVCATVDVDPLGYGTNCPDNTGGPFSVFDLKECLFDQNREHAPLYIDVAFPSDPVCGNGRLEGDEVCDNGLDNSDTAPDACRSDCTLPRCGDGVVDPSSGDACDDGNNDDGDGCNANCIIEFCGDGIVNNGGSEECDNGAANSDTAADACRSDCTLPSCGDGVTDPANSEECDDGNTVSADFCSGLDADQPCQVEFCGDGIVQGGLLNEECDLGTGNNSNTTPDTCREDCKNFRCGDGIVDSGEDCDGDGAGNGGESAVCDADCSVAVCGDGTVNVSAGEVCDDGNTSDNDSCPSGALGNCLAFASCGDGIVCNDGATCDSGPGGGDEICDDGNQANDDGCDDAVAEGGNCSPTGCGNGVLTSGEECDDGNANSDSTPDACRTNCLLPSCGDGVRDPVTNGEPCDGTDTSGCASDELCVNNAGTCECSHQCPGFGELLLVSGATNACTTNADCRVGQCEPSLGVCLTVTSLDSGWTGLSHNADVNDNTLTRAFLECPGTGPVCGECNIVGVDPSPGNCRCNENIRMICDQPFEVDANDCNVGPCVDNVCVNDDKFPSARSCQSDSDCLLTCDCYFGAPFALSTSGVPACVVNRFAEDIVGTADVDLGAGSVTAKLRTIVSTGGNTTTDPCPKCGGTCSADSSFFCSADLDCSLGPCIDRFGTLGCFKDTNVSCAVNADCDLGSCNMDDVMGDGVRNGVCVGGRYEGLPCDVYANNTTFPTRTDGPGGAGYSLDCIPDPLTNVSGSGLRIELTQSTAESVMTATAECGGLIPGLKCPCKMCSSDTSVPCNSDADCAGQAGKCALVNSRSCLTTADCQNVDAGPCSGIGRCSGSLTVRCTVDEDCIIDGGACEPPTCSSTGGGSAAVPQPNKCTDGICVDVGGGKGECNTGPDDGFCDGVVRANGDPVLTCSSDGDCVETSTGVPGGAGDCTIQKRRPCFLDPIVATGIADPNNPVGATIFCIPPTSSGGINTVAGLPGPGRARNQGIATTFCRDNPEIRYEPGVGGCP